MKSFVQRNRNKIRRVVKILAIPKVVVTLRNSREARHYVVIYLLLFHSTCVDNCTSSYCCNDVASGVVQMMTWHYVVGGR